MKQVIKTGKEILQDNNLIESDLYVNLKPTNKFQLKNENNEWVDVTDIVKKEAVEYIIKVQGYDDLYVADKHTFIMEDNTHKWAKDLIVGDVLKNINGGVSVLEIINTNKEQLMIDLEVKSPTHLYQDAQGFVHHNSFGVDKQLTEMFGPEMGGKNPNWAIFKGKVNEASVYETLHKHNSKVIVFDDADSVFGSTDAVNLLKAALDTKAHRYVSRVTKDPQLFDPQNPPFIHEDLVFDTPMRARATLTKEFRKAERKDELDTALPEDFQEKHGLDYPLYIDMLIEAPIEERHQRAIEFGKIPSTFEFTGSIIFISNKKLQDIDTAIRDRSIAPIELDMSTAQIIDRIEHIMEYLKPGDDGDNVEDLNLSQKQAVLDHFREAMEKYGRTNVSLRAFKTSMLYYTMDPTNWKELVSLYVGI